MRTVSRTLAVACFALACAGAGRAADPLQVKTDKGVVEGAFTSDQQVRAFKGIPFAAPPVGDLRWKPPQPGAKWKSVRSAKEFGHRCYQAANYGDMLFHDEGPSEDCLTLNVWTPASAPKGSLPVMVWIYGGGFTGGGTSEGRQDGQFLAHRNVVVVSMNYRLGMLGFFAHPELTAESPHHASGNYGLMDQTAALEWVRANIAAFGGDPKNVTLFGESAGSFAVSTQMASPIAKNLFQKAIGESGGAFYSGGLGYPTRATAEEQGAKFAADTLHASSLAALRKMSAEDLIKAGMAHTTPPPPRFGPDIDGYFLTETVPAVYAAGKQAHIPLLAGWNADEVRGGITSAAVKPTPESFAADAQKNFGERSAQFLALYPSATPEDAIRSAGDYAGDRFLVYSTWRWLEAQVETGHAPVYRYSFDLGSPGDKFHPATAGAFHSDEIEYVFGSLDYRQEAVWRPQDRQLSAQMGQYWSNFARTGDPNGPGLPEWPRYEAKDGWEVMHLDAQSAAKPDSLRPRYLFLDQAWGKTRD